MRSISKEKIVGLRNILSHEYAAIDPEAIFNTIKIGIPPLLTTLKQQQTIKAFKNHEHTDRL